MIMLAKREAPGFSLKLPISRVEKNRSNTPCLMQLAVARFHCSPLGARVHVDTGTLSTMLVLCTWLSDHDGKVLR